MKVQAFVEHTMGMAISLHVRSGGLSTADTRTDILDGVERSFALLRRADEVFSTYRPDSQLMQIRGGLLQPQDADPWIDEVRGLCEEAANVTNGLFSTDLIGPDGSRGWDPTGVVKGWAVERAADELRRIPGISFCLNAGGDMAADTGAGALPADVETQWRVGIADPHDAQNVTDVVTISEGALATSGTAERGAHIIDPRTGAPAPAKCTSITVVGPNLAWADIWATVSMIDDEALVFSRMAASYRVAARTE